MRSLYESLRCLTSHGESAGGLDGEDNAVSTWYRKSIGRTPSLGNTLHFRPPVSRDKRDRLRGPVRSLIY
jgi:hypothetical protein